MVYNPDYQTTRQPDNQTTRQPDKITMSCVLPTYTEKELGLTERKRNVLLSEFALLEKDVHKMMEKRESAIQDLESAIARARLCLKSKIEQALPVGNHTAPRPKH